MLGLAAQHRQAGEQRVGCAEQRRLEGARQRQVVRGRDQYVEQGHHVLHLGRFAEVGLFRLHAGNVQRAQRLLHAGQAVALARQHHDFVRRHAHGDARGHPLRGLGALAHAQGFFGLVARGGEAVAPGWRGGVGVVAGVIGLGDGRQAQQLACMARFRGVVAKAAVLLQALRRLHGGVHGGDDAARVAPRVVAGQQVATQAVAHKGLGGLEHLRLGAAEAVDALLGVAHDEHAGWALAAGAAAGAHVGGQPGVQRLPLQRVGVLELIDQQVAHTRVQALLHPAAQGGVRQHDQRRALDVVHVHPATCALELGKRGDQAARQARQALLVLPGFMLGACRTQWQQLGLGLLRGGELLQVLRQPVFLGNEEGLAQAVQALVQARIEPRRKGIDHGVGSFLWRLGALGAQLLGPGQPARACCITRQRLGGRGQAGQARKLFAERWHRGIDDARGVGQLELHALGQRRLQRLVRLRAAMARHSGLIVGAQPGVLQHRREEGPPDLAHGLGVVLQQFVVRGQAAFLQQGQRGRAQQRREPAVEGADLHRPAAGEQGLVQISERLAQLPRGLGGNSACHQLLFELCGRGVGELLQPLLQALTHLARRLLGEGDGEDFMRRAALQQRAQHARHQHPGLARARAGLDGDAALRVAGNGVEGLARDGLAVVFVGGVMHSRNPCGTGRARHTTRTRCPRPVQAAARPRRCVPYRPRCPR